MQRRDFSSRLAATAALLAAGPALAQAAPPVEGRHFVRVNPAAPVGAPAGKIEVVEFFWYGCPHCNALEPALEAWVKRLPADVVFRRVPVAFSAVHESHQRLFYTLEAMGQLEAAHDKLFALFFTEQVRPAGNKPEAVADWAARAGVDRARFLEAYQSFGVAGKVRRASQLADLYQVEGTPAVGIAGRFLVPGQAERTLPIVNTLIAEARKG